MSWDMTKGTCNTLILAIAGTFRWSDMTFGNL